MANNIAWTTKEIEWLRMNRRNRKYAELLELHNQVYPDRQRTHASIKGGIRRYCDKRRYRRFNEDEINWIIQNRELPKRELGRQFRLTFGGYRSDDTLSYKRLTIGKGGA